MSYLALYRKFRPTDFDSVEEQKHITTTLKNQITLDRIGHAYLFCGTRGTGKTSIAKIFARAVNCENPINGNPCGKCPTCIALSRPDNMDIIEMDAASNNGVDDLRDLRDKAAFQPTVGKYKVYIVDEVHMLSINAFNALLKTLEEPPKHVIFILATTEVQKIPATILSRCMRFDFRLISTDTIYNYLKKVYNSINKEFEEDALYAIARAGEGSMRDALSFADICLSLSDGKLTFKDVSSVLGNLSRETLYNLFNAVIGKDASLSLSIINDLINSGKTPSMIAKDFAGLFRDLLIIKLSNSSNTLNYPDEVLEKYTEFASLSDTTMLLRGLEIFGELDSKLRLSTNQRLVLETAILKIVDPINDLSILSINRRLSLLEEKVSTGNFSVTKASNEIEKTTSINVPPQREMDKKEKEDNSTCGAILKGQILKYLRENNSYPLFSAISFATIYVNDNIVTIEVSSKDNKDFFMEKTNFDCLKKAFATFGHENVTVSIKSNEDKIKEQNIIDKANKLSNGSLVIKE